MCTELRPSGLAPVRPLPWGTHFCQFYRTTEDLLAALVPFFAAGLAANEQCLWATPTALPPAAAERALRAAVPDLDAYLARGQLEIVAADDWYRDGAFDGARTIAGWLERERHARELGFDGLRVTGDTAWLHDGGDWDAFLEYERGVTDAFRDFRLVALCTYRLDRCGAEQMLDVVGCHEFAVARRADDWEVVESAALKVAKSELARSNATLERRVVERTQALEEAVRARDEFIAMLGHELRNPLAPIRNAAHLVRMRAGGDPALARAGEMLERQARQMTRLVDDLLDVARITQGKVAIARERLELSIAVAQAVEAVRAALEARGHGLAIEATEPLWVEGDRQRLAQVFANLLDNAIKYTPPGGRVSVRLERRGDAAVATIRDTGVGIEPALLERIFEPFAQVDRTLDRAAGGLGLGLALVRRIVDLHGGRIEAASEGPGTGTEMRVTLALAPPPLAANDEAAAPARPRAPARRVLVVDDNADAAASLALLLELDGHEVEVARNGAAALDLAARARPDLVLLDLGLPDVSGYEVAARLRDAGVANVVALTGYGDPSARARSRAAGCALHLTKPVDVERLRALLLS